MNGEDEDVTLPDGPDSFRDKKWPCPRLDRNRPTGKDLALVFYMDWFQVSPDDVTNNRCRYVRVRCTASFRCWECGKGWTSRHAWVSFDMKKQTVRRCFGQKCTQ